MKRTQLLITGAVLALSLAACGGMEDDPAFDEAESAALCDPVDPECEPPMPVPRPDLRVSMGAYSGPCEPGAVINVTVSNEGTARAGASTARVSYGFNRSTPALDPWESHTFGVALQCSFSACSFNVYADYFRVVTESIEYNNSRTWSCAR